MVFIKNDDDGPVEFKTSKFKYNFCPGSNMSLALHTALAKTESENVFQSEIIQMILNYKWGLVKKIAYMQAAALIIYTLLLFIHSEFGRMEKPYVQAILCYNFVFVLVEGF